MLFSEVLGLPHIKNHLTTTADRGRIPHAQLFVGSHGSGLLPMAIAYSQYILCNNNGQENNTGNTSCNSRFSNLAHPDLHFAFPVATTEQVKSKPISSNFLSSWREFVKEDPYGSLYDWYQKLGIENKQGQIGVDEAQDILKSLSLKSYEGGYKVMLIWMADKMNTAASNKLLKLIEEPPDKTLFILIAEDEEQIIQTIRSRCQILRFPPLPEAVIAEALENYHQADPGNATNIAVQANGSYARALHIMRKDAGDEQFEALFIKWVRTAFKAKGNKASIIDLISWSEEIAGMGRESQKSFLLYCLNFFRQALLLNYNAGNLVYMKMQAADFKLEKFAPFVNDLNILGISKEIEDAIYHIERNGNSRIILTDLSIKLTRLLHKKAA
ncbi:DNA polymerase III subunit delta' [Antarcticibacterium flavum]|uniref:DNA polymerase III subunit delta n=1 Tax=Antarcticibacterium flavum TaxID=2058175 RepID=A0A5B7X4F5_9FLAO|nr:MULTISPECIES: DNA polymerase III subunit delta' [Antarcticibacterium]MCM4159213.1 DNA polymerase III subunit delta' [Antarcticibacterium sp. W02-3]QCY69611.1 DNA polymerase III subunit delta' [Antarcticibacterium flavum]